MSEPWKRREVIGDAVLYLGDCLEILPTLPKVDAVITDPPYGEVNRLTGGLRSLDKGIADLVTCSADEILNLVEMGNSAYVWCGTEQISALRAGMILRGYSTRLCVWEKTNPSPMNGEHIWLSGIESCVFGKRRAAYFSEFCKVPVFRGPSEDKQEHPTQKPIWLMQRLVNASVDKGATAIDPFMGSGTTGVACMQLGRKFIGIEIEPKYFDIACERITNAQRQAKLFEPPKPEQLTL